MYFRLHASFSFFDCVFCCAFWFVFRFCCVRFFVLFGSVLFLLFLAARFRLRYVFRVCYFYLALVFTLTQYSIRCCSFGFSLAKIFTFGFITLSLCVRVLFGLAVFSLRFAPDALLVLLFLPSSVFDVCACHLA